MKKLIIIVGIIFSILSGNSQTRYQINTAATAGGSITATLQIDSGTNFRITFTAYSNYRIDSIIINDTLNAKDSFNGYTFRNVRSNQKIRLVFKRFYFIAILKNRGMILKDTLRADSGKNIRVNFTADKGFRIDSIFVNGNSISLDSITGYSFYNLTSNQSIRLSLGKIYDIITTTSVGGIIEDTIRVDSAANTQLLFYPDSGYFLDTLIINNTIMVYDSLNSYTFYNVQSNQKAAAMFSPFCASIDSSILSYDSSAHLDSFLVTAPNCRWQAVANVPWISIRNVKNTGTGYVKFSIQANTDTLNRVGIITVGDKQRVVEQRYLPLTYYLNVYEQYNQLLILKNTIEVQENSNKLFKINTTPTNFAFVEIVLDSTIIHDTSLLLSRINANHKIVFKYQYISNNSFTTIQNGIISPINLDVDRGANVRFSYVPDSGYEFDYVIANGEVNYDSPTNFTLYNIDTNSHLDVFFKPIYRTITVNKTYKTNNKITYQEKFIYPENAQFANANYIFIDTVNNVKITFPIDSQNQNIQVAVTKVNNIDTMLPFYGGNSYKRVGAVYSIDLLNIDTSGIFKLVTIPYNPNLVSDPQNIEAAYYNDSLGKWLSAGVVSIDTIYHNISFYTNHFSRWTIYSNEKITTDFPDFDTGFRPDKDGFYFPNDLPVPYNDPKGRNGESANGNCFGFSAISLLYYIFKDLNAINLYNLSFNGPPIISENKYNTPVYRNFNILLYESIFHTSEYLNNSEATNNLVTFTDYEKTKKSYNDKSLTSLFYNELMKFKSPFIGLFQLAGEIGNSNFIRWFKGPGHVVVFYRYKKNNDGTGRFYYYDNNIPGEELFITHNKDGSFPNNVLASLSSTKEPFKIAKYGTISLGQYDIQTVLNLMGSNFVPLYFNVTTSIDYGTISPSKQIRQGDIYTINVTS